MVVTLARRWMLVDDKNLGTRKRFELLEVACALPKDAANDALFDDNIMSDVERHLLCLVNLLTDVAMVLPPWPIVLGR